MNNSGQKSVLTVSSLVKTPQSNQFISLNQQQMLQGNRNLGFLDLVSPDHKPDQFMRNISCLTLLEMQQEFAMEQKKLQQQNEMRFMLGELVEEEKLSKRKLAEMIYDVMQDSNDSAKQEKTIKVLIRTLLKSGSLIPKAIDPEQIILM